jgi:hypothetical protein
MNKDIVGIGTLFMVAGAWVFYWANQGTDMVGAIIALMVFLPGLAFVLLGVTENVNTSINN